MTKEKHQQLQQQYNEMWKTNWTEIIGSMIVAAGIALLAYLWFSIL